MSNRIIPRFALYATVVSIVLFIAACTAPVDVAADMETAGSPAGETTTTSANQEPDQGMADLAAVKQYVLENGGEMKTGTVDLVAVSQEYFDRVQEVSAEHPDADPYQYLWDEHADEMIERTDRIKAAWLQSSQYYELNEGVIAGVPSLAFYDVWIDAGPSGAESPAEAYEWTLELPNGETLDSPGNFFHSLLEPTIWGTNPDYIGLAVDFDGDGSIGVGESLPNADMILGAALGLDGATAEMIAAVEEWKPSPSDAFTALVVMIPTMNEYFEQWKLSTYIAGADAEEAAFVGNSRLFDITNILNGLDITYQNVSPLVEPDHTDLHGQIVDGFADLRGYVDELYAEELTGRIFSAEEADLFGTEAQEKATALAGQVAQAAALLEIPIVE